MEDENRQLKLSLDLMREKYEHSEGEVKYLLRKINKLLEEKVERLQEELNKTLSGLDTITQV